MGLLAGLLGLPSSDRGLGTMLGKSIKKKRRKKRWGEEDYLKEYDPKRYLELMGKKKRAARNIRLTQGPLGGLWGKMGGVMGPSLGGGAEEGLPFGYTDEYRRLKHKKPWEV